MTNKVLKQITVLSGLISFAIASTDLLLSTFDTDASGGLNSTEIEHFLERFRTEDGELEGCPNATEILNGATELGTAEELNDLLAKAVPCLLETTCASSFSLEVEEEAYSCSLVEEDHDHDHEEEEHEHEHEEGTVILFAGSSEFECTHTEEEEEGNDTFDEATWMRVVFSTLGVCLISLVGVVLIIFGMADSQNDFIQNLLDDAVAFSLGILLFVAFVHVLPEGVENIEEPEDFGYWIIIGMGIAAFVELFWPVVFNAIFKTNYSHGHGTQEMIVKPKDDENAEALVESSPKGVSGDTGGIIANICLGDFLHNFVDGVLIALAFGVCDSTSLGTSVTVGIVAHELPQEISDFLILVRCGLSYKKALAFNLLSSVSALIGAILVLSLGNLENKLQGQLLLASAGLLGFVTLAQIWPLVEKSAHNNTDLVRRSVFMLLGVGLGALLKQTVAHEHCHIGHDHEHEHEH